MSSQLLQAPPPGQTVRNYNAGNIRLRKGDFAVFQLQFRIGDDDTISNDWQALHALESISIPWVPWDNANPDAFTAGFTALSLPGLQGSPPVYFPELLSAPFDHAAVDHYFEDLVQNGQDAFLCSHVGAASTVMSNTVNNTMVTMADRLLNRVIEKGNMDVLLERLRACGRHDLVEKLSQ